MCMIRVYSVCRPWSDATFCSIWSWSALFVKTSVSVLKVIIAGLSDSVGCTFYWWSGGCGYNPCQVLWHSFLAIDHEIFLCSFYILLIQEGQLSVSGERMCTSTGSPLTGLSLPRKKVWLGKLTSYSALPSQIYWAVKSQHKQTLGYYGIHVHHLCSLIFVLTWCLFWQRLYLC